MSASELAPDQVEPRKLEAVLLLEMGAYGATIEALQRATAVPDDDPELRLLTGDAHYAAGNVAEAR